MLDLLFSINDCINITIIITIKLLLSLLYKKKDLNLN